MRHHSTFAATEEDHDPSVSAHTGNRHRGLRVQLFRLSGPLSYIDRQMLKGNCKCAASGRDCAPASAARRRTVGERSLNIASY